MMTMNHKLSFAICVLALSLLTGMRLGAASRVKPVPIVLDTDIGSDIDDAFALALVLESPQLDLRAVTTVSGDTQARARIAAKMLWESGRKEVPVAAGEPGGKLDISQAHWADGFTSPSLGSEKAIDLMKQKIDRSHGKMVIVAIGPLSNVAALLQSYPQEKKKIRQIVLMGGSLSRGYYPGSGQIAESNIASDIPAARAVFSSGIPILMAPLDVTARLQLEAPNLQRLFAHSTPLINALHQLYLEWGEPIPTLHDPMAVSLLLNPDLCTTKAMSIQIDDHGMTREVSGSPTNAVVAIETNPVKFIEFYMNRVAR